MDDVIKLLHYNIVDVETKADKLKCFVVNRMKRPSEKKRQYCESPIGNCMDDTTCPTFAQIRKNSPALFIPQIEYLTAAEFESVPK